MALKACKDCGQPVSRKAKTCPKCGAPIKENVGCLQTALGLILLGIIISIIVKTTSDDKSPTSDQPSTPQPKNSAVHKRSSIPKVRDTVSYRVPGILGIRWSDSRSVIKKKMSTDTQAKYEDVEPGINYDLLFSGGKYFDEDVEKWMFLFDKHELKRITIVFLNYSTDASVRIFLRLKSQFGDSDQGGTYGSDPASWHFPDGSMVEVYSVPERESSGYPALLLTYDRHQLPNTP